MCSVLFFGDSSFQSGGILLHVWRWRVREGSGESRSSFHVFIIIKRSIWQFLPEYSIVGLIYKVIDDQVNYCREIRLWRLRM